MGNARDDRLFRLVLDRHGAAQDHERRDSGEIEDQVLEHGRIEVETFREIVAHVENDERFDEVGDWIGMVRAAKEYFEIVDPDRLEEVREIVEAWSETWTGGDHDPDKFNEVWGR
ncbi:hypothetical protein HKCCE3408_05090 [Rhodobacterales bacterium HKCCE3408]|nr:hypothetical protein [Rhodobacterales bacterium HKCCE3408]